MGEDGNKTRIVLTDGKISANDFRKAIVQTMANWCFAEAEDISDSMALGVFSNRVLTEVRAKTGIIIDCHPLTTSGEIVAAYSSQIAT